MKDLVLVRCHERLLLKLTANAIHSQTVQVTKERCHNGNPPELVPTPVNVLDVGKFSKASAVRPTKRVKNQPEAESSILHDSGVPKDIVLNQPCFLSGLVKLELAAQPHHLARLRRLDHESRQLSERLFREPRPSVANEKLADVLHEPIDLVPSGR